MSDTEVRAGGAFVEIGGRNTEFKRSLGDSLKMFREWGAELRNLGLELLAGLMGVGAGMVKALADSAKMEETTSKFNTVFKENAKQARAWAIQYADSIGRGHEQMLAFMATIEDMLVPMGFSRELAMQFSKSIAGLAQDLSSFSNLDPAEALRDIESAMVGNHEAVRKYGVMITEVSLGQQLFKMGIRGGVQAASEQQKVLARLSMIMNGNSDAQGDAIRTAGSWTNTTRALVGQLTNLSQGIGDQLRIFLKPYLDGLVYAVRWTQIWIAQNPEFVSGILKAFETLAAVAGILIAVGVGILFMTSAAFPITLLIAGILGILEAFGLVDTGLSDLSKSFRVKGMSIYAWWKILVQNLHMAWVWFKNGFLEVMDFMVGKFQKVASAIGGTWMVFMKNIGMIGEKELDDYFAAQEELNNENASKAGDRKKARDSETDLAFQGGLGAIDDIEAQDKKNAWKGNVNVPTVKAPKMPNFSELIDRAMKESPGLPQTLKRGVVSFTGASNFGEQMGAAFGAQSMDQQQLTTQKSMLETLKGIEQNTRGTAATFA